MNTQDDAAQAYARHCKSGDSEGDGARFGAAPGDGEGKHAVNSRRLGRVGAGEEGELALATSRKTGRARSRAYLLP